MSVRPALTAIGCRSCQRAVLRAVVPSFTGGLSRTLPRTQPSLALRPRFYSELPKAQATPQSAAAEADAKLEEELLEDEGETPWFLEELPPRHAPSLHAAALPKAPEDGPAMIEPMIKYIYEDMGLDEISLLDLRELDPPASLGSNLIMLIATARSERHLHISAGRFVRWLRRNYGVSANADGLIGPGELKTKLRRLRKKAKLMGSNSAILPGGDNGISTGWVCVNFAMQGRGGAAEGAVYDDSGKMSGFGSAQTGTTVVIQCMTETRREELDLELLWRGILKRNLEEQTKVRGEPGLDSAAMEKVLSSKLQVPTSPSKLQWEALKDASQQQRHMSTAKTELRRSKVADQTKGASPKSGHAVGGNRGDVGSNDLHLEEIRPIIESILYNGATLDRDRLQQLLADILRAPFSSDYSVADRLAWVDSLLRTAEERGLEIESVEILVLLIESLVRSPAYGPELKKAQEGLELLLRESEEPPTDDHTIALMNAYAAHEDWERVWDAFRVPPRFNLARSPRLYETAYRLLASTARPEMCRDALRWIYPEMLLEKPAVGPVGDLYEWLKTTILVANPLAMAELARLGRRRLTRKTERQPSEFARVLDEVEALRSKLEQREQLG